MLKVKRGVAIETFSNDAPNEFKHIVLKHATQEQLEWLFKRKHPAVFKEKKKPAKGK